MSIECFDLDKWIENNKIDFKPPICNKCMFSDQLKVFFIGGPNERNDYHIEMGEELFVQFQGDMCLKVMEQNLPKDIHIKQGQMFMLPAKIVHSPQRFVDTIGMVIERTRKESELDGLRWHYVTEFGQMDVLYERWFHLTDVVKDLPPAIKAFKESAACKTNRPDQSSVVIKDRPYQIDSKTKLMEPVNIVDVIQGKKDEIQKKGWAKIFGAPNFCTDVTLYGNGVHLIEPIDPIKCFAETFVWLEEGSATVNISTEKVELTKPRSMCLVPNNTEFTLTVDDGYCFCVQMPTPK